MSLLRTANELGVWDFLQFMLWVAGGTAAVLVYRRRRYDQFSLHTSFRLGTGHSVYRNVLYFSARNLGDSPIVLCRPNFKPTKHLKLDDSAHGNLDTEDYELKFRYLDSRYKVEEGNSYTTLMLRHRQSAMAYIPISSDYTEESFGVLKGSRNLGWITFDIVAIGEGKPKVTRIRQQVKRVVLETHSFSLGFDPNKGPEKPVT